MRFVILVVLAACATDPVDQPDDPPSEIQLVPPANDGHCPIVADDGPCAVACDWQALQSYIPSNTCAIFQCTGEDGTPMHAGGCHFE